MTMLKLWFVNSHIWTIWSTFTMCFFWITNHNCIICMSECMSDTVLEESRKLQVMFFLETVLLLLASKERSYFVNPSRDWASPGQNFSLSKIWFFSASSLFLGMAYVMFLQALSLGLKNDRFSAALGRISLEHFISKDSNWAMFLNKTSGLFEESPTSLLGLATVSRLRKFLWL